MDCAPGAATDRAFASVVVLVTNCLTPAPQVTALPSVSVHAPPEVDANAAAAVFGRVAVVVGALVAARVWPRFTLSVAAEPAARLVSFSEFMPTLAAGGCRLAITSSVAVSSVVPDCTSEASPTPVTTPDRSDAGRGVLRTATVPSPRAVLAVLAEVPPVPPLGSDSGRSDSGTDAAAAAAASPAPSNAPPR